MLYTKEHKKCLAVLILLILSFTNISSFAKNTYTYESKLGYGVNFDENKISVESKNNKDYYYYEELEGPTVSIIKDTNKEKALELKYTELEKNSKESTYLKKLMPENFEDRELKASKEITKEKDSVELEIQMNTGEYFIPFYNIKYTYKKNTDSEVFEIVHTYYSESIESDSYKEITSLIDSLQSLNSENKTPSSTEETTTKSTKTDISSNTNETNTSEVTTPDNQLFNLSSINNLSPFVYIIIGFFFIIIIIAIIITLKNKKNNTYKFI